jgi:hypothetical protein
LRERGAERALTHIFTHNKGADCANIYESKFGELLCQNRRLKSIVFSEVSTAKKYNPTHPSTVSRVNLADTLFYAEVPRRDTVLKTTILSISKEAIMITVMVATGNTGKKIA